MRKKVLVVAMALGFFVMSTGTAQAWDLIHDRHGYGRVTLRAWTQNYNQVAFVADHAGTRVDVAVVVNCRNGDHYDNTWSDGGRRFRFILGGLGNSGRCNHTFRVLASDPTDILDLYVYGRG
jgi:hypothetical protein